MRGFKYNFAEVDILRVILRQLENAVEGNKIGFFIVAVICNGKILCGTVKCCCYRAALARLNIYYKGSSARIGLRL